MYSGSTTSVYLTHQVIINHLWKISQGCTTVNNSSFPICRIEYICGNVENIITHLNGLHINIVMRPKIVNGSKIMTTFIS